MKVQVDTLASHKSTSADVSVIICAYTEKRWSDLVAAIASVRSQTVRPREIIVVIDHNPPLLQRVRDGMLGVTVVANAEERGLSGARNSGLAAAHGSIVAFLDDDAIAEPDWLERLVGVFDDPSVLVAGGAVNSEWQCHPPRWFPDEFHWVVGCTYRGMPTTRTQVRNPIGANMAFRRAVFEHIGTFRAGIGRVGTLPVGCEETELCIRYRQQLPHGRIVYEPLARVRHRVSPPRTTLRYFAARCFAEGCSKALVTRLVGSDDGLASERAYTLRTLPNGVMRGVRDAVRGDAAGLARSAAIMAGLAATTLGYTVGSVTGRRRKGSQVASSALSTRVTREPALLQRSHGQWFNQKGEAMRWIEFDIHGRASMRVDAGAPTAPLIRDMFAPFLSQRPLSSFDLTITGKIQPVSGVFLVTLNTNTRIVHCISPKPKCKSSWTRTAFTSTAQGNCWSLRYHSSTGSW